MIVFNKNPKLLLPPISSSTTVSEKATKRPIETEFENENIFKKFKENESNLLNSNNQEFLQSFGFKLK